ncbi:MAG: 50S ribosomal protein L18Ae [Methanocellales archaeon]|nr:50S ribosomal protein L18Ae [Methanocellales archaeon]MDD3421671.1 50S ribosomal protein L18Ae [Methanocellales archaeon]MDD4898632.1 50S ribosomal protein L18Ae [Methanocellales archaeon]MDD5447298.1 50S ribosomal protein L18Ae [Methanocellales archaeon]
MKTFIIEGEFRAGNEWEKFKKQVQGQNERSAIEKLYSLVGSKHGLKRNFIKIHSVREE